MLATSMRQPSSSNGGRASAGHCGHSAGESSGERPVELRQGANPEPRLVAVRQGVVEVEELRSGASGLARAREPVVRDADVVQGQVADHPHAATMGGAAARPAPRRRRAAGRRGRRTSRRIGACLSPGRSGSGRSHWRRAARCGRAAPRCRRGRRRRAPAACPGPRPSATRPRSAAPPTPGVSRCARGWRSGRERSGRRPSAGAIPALRGRRRHEVVGVRDVVVDQPEPVHPPVADVPAGEQPAVQRDGIPDREGRAPPGLRLGLLVDLGTHGAGLPVAHVAEPDLVGRCSSRHAQPHRRLAAQLGWAVDDVELGAVVVRGGRGRSSLHAAGQALDDEPLQEEEEDHDRDRRQDDSGAERAPFLAVLVRNEA